MRLYISNLMLANENLVPLLNGALLVICWFLCSFFRSRINVTKGTTFRELLYFGWYREDCLALWNSTDKKLQKLYKFIRWVSIEKDIPEISLLRLFWTFALEFAEKKFNEPYFTCVIATTCRNHLNEVFWILRKNVANRVGVVHFFQVSLKSSL